MCSSGNKPRHAHAVSIAPDLSASGQALLREFVDSLPEPEGCFAADGFHDDVEFLRRQFQRRRIARQSRLAVVAAISVIADLAKQGWRFAIEDNQIVGNPSDRSKKVTREVKQAQLLAQRDEQLRTGSTRQFIRDMERSRLHGGRRVSIFSLMRDGRELADALDAAMRSDDRVKALREVVDPYLQFVGPDARCNHTGLRLTDIWRYFRHTWSNPYNSIPGRTMMFLVRDRAAGCHPVLGLGALSSSAVKLRSRDDAIGWEADVMLEEIREDDRGKARLFKYLLASTSQWLDELYRIDLVEDGLLPNDLASEVSDDCLERLRDESRNSREVHNRLMGSEGYKKQAPENDDDGQIEHWEQQARSPLFRSKRAGGFAALLAIRKTLLEATDGADPAEAMDRLIATGASRRAVSQIIRRAKARSVGTCIADLTVCGAIPPYGPLLGGKLVAMLAIGPEMVSAYKRRYGKAVSIIASSMAGRPIIRPADLAFIGTTSLYGIRPCQYDRVSIPLERLGGSKGGALRYEFMSTSRGWGTFHFGAATARAVASYVKSKKDGVRVNYVFGEGANPRLRALREGLGALGLDEESLLHHGNPKLIYGVRLIINLRNYLLGIDSKPKYLFPKRSPRTATDGIVSWWVRRWLLRRLQREDRERILDDVREHTQVHPIIHGARVRLPDQDVGQESLFG